jgi:dihydroorotase-like cyclic amidohydrolase
VVDFALWGGLVPGNLDQMEALAARGAIGFKAFMSSTGVDDFAAADDLTLYEGMARAAALGLPVAVHAENDAITGLLARRAVAQGRTTARDYLASRPVIAELEAIARAILLARETGCALHIVHVSTGRGVELVAEARRQGVDVTCETCPHYLLLDEDDLERANSNSPRAYSNTPLPGALAKCAPPLRPRAEQEALWEHLRTGALPMIASDHSPAPADLKLPSAKGADFFQIWGGISGCQSTLPLLLDAGHLHRGLPLTTIARACATFPAERFGLASPEAQRAQTPSASPPPKAPQLKVSDPQGSWAQRNVGDLQGECNTPQGEVPSGRVQDERPRLWRGKGRLAAGADADLALIDLRGEDTITADRLFYRHRHSPYLGRTVRGRVVRTLVRGTTVFLDGRIVAPPAGRLVTPALVASGE